MGDIDFGILGPLRVRDGDDVIALTASKRRALLALLVLSPGRIVGTDVLVEELWGDAPPARATATLQAHVSHLRRALGPSAPTIEARPPGYVLHVDPQCVDAVRFETSAAAGRAASAAGDPGAAVRHFGDALALWRGRPLEDLSEFVFAEREATRLEVLRLDVLRERIDAELARGRHLDVLPEIAMLVADHPFDEHLAGQHLIALYRAGRQTDALRAYQRTRTLLAEELGIEPGPALRDIERAILGHEPALALASSGAPPPPPTGTVTFLFTDIERSTSLWDQAPDAMAAALQQHDQLLRATVEDHGGLVFHHAGDGMGAVFTRCRDALDASLIAQRRLRETDWGAIELRVRMAVHTGEADERDGNYFGPTLNRAARLRDAGHGGQVLVSETSRQLALESPLEPPCQDAPSGDAPLAWSEQHFRDLGSWLFDGVSRAERVFQLVHPALPLTFPPLRSGRSDAGRLPRRATSLIGRDDERARLAALLDQHPLITLLGEGGIGKTRLAIVAAEDRAARADRVPGGVWFCDLSEVVDERGLVERVALCIGVASGSADLRRDLVTALRAAPLLLVLDNCEQLRAEVGTLVHEILEETTAVSILATSRAPLRVDGEHLFPVRPLALPDGPAVPAASAPVAERPVLELEAAGSSGAPVPVAHPAPDASPAVALLVERARAAGAEVREGDPALDEIARRLDGVPLALELAAPRLATMSADALVARLDKRFDLLTRDGGGGPERQRALRATLDWSLGLLTPAARDLYDALSACAGGWTLEAAEAIAPAVGLAAPSAAMVLAHLVDMSMVQLDVRAPGTGRYSMLETVRAYGVERLEQSGRRPAVLAAHAAHFLAVAEQAARERRGPGEGAWVSVVDTAFDNIRVAFRTLMDTDHLVDATRLLLALVDEVILRERQEVARWALELAARPDARALPERRIALAITSNAAMIEGRLEDAMRDGREAVRLEPAAVAAPDDPGSASAGLVTWVARNTMALLSIAGLGTDPWQDHLDAMVRIAEVAADPMGRAVSLYDRALIATLMGHPERGREAAAELLALGQQSGNPTMRAMGLLSLARVGAEDGAAAVHPLLFEALDLASSVGNTLLVNEATRAIVENQAHHGDKAAALASLRGVLEQFERAGDVNQQLRTVLSMLDSLLAMDALPLVAVICGALGRTPWGLTASCRVVDGMAKARLGAAAHQAAHEQGVALEPAELIDHVRRELAGLVGNEPVGP